MEQHANHFRSPEFCPIDESFPLWIQKRAIGYRNDPAGLEKQGYWYHVLEDKVAGHLLTRAQNLPSPRIYCCLTNVTELFSSLKTSVPDTISGIVVKATRFHSNQGIYVLVNDPSNKHPKELKIRWLMFIFRFTTRAIFFSSLGLLVRPVLYVEHRY
jgi:hypothetical protein